MAGLLPAMRERAQRCDAEAKLPLDDLRALQRVGAFTAADDCVHDLLVMLGRGSAAVGRLIEAHLNAIRLIRQYGTEVQAEEAGKDAREGRLFGLWVTDVLGDPVRLVNGRLNGSKAPCSGVGAVERVLTTVETERGGVLAVIPADVLQTEALPPISGMRAAAQGRAVFSDVACPPECLVGAVGDYLREPELSCGAWRTSAVTLGVVESLVEALRTHLQARGHTGAPLQQERFGRMLIARDTARMWVRTACDAAGDQGRSVTERVARVNLARVAVELACLDVLTLVQRSAGLGAFLPGPIDRISRDLATYLRQPAPDAVLTEAAAFHLQISM